MSYPGGVFGRVPVGLEALYKRLVGFARGALGWGSAVVVNEQDPRASAARGLIADG